MRLARRQFGFVLSVGAALSTGCLTTGTSDANDSEGAMQSTEPPRFEMRFEPNTVGNSIQSRERVIVTNVSDRQRSLSGYFLTYQSGYEYTFSGLVLEPRAKVAVLSQGEDDAVAQSDPPTYYRGAGFDSLVLEDGRETVTLVSPDGEVGLEATYEEGVGNSFSRTDSARSFR